MNIRINLKNGFLKGSVFGNLDVYGRLTIEERNIKKELLIYFYQDEGVIEVTHNHNKVEKEGLSKKERYAIIETILKEYTTFSKSLLHVSASYYLENYVLIDTTNVERKEPIKRNSKQKGILYEYLNSKKPYNTTSLLFRELKNIYEELNAQKRKIGKENLIIYIDAKLNYFEKKDLIYFTHNMLSNLDLDEKVTLNIPKSAPILEINCN